MSASKKQRTSLLIVGSRVGTSVGLGFGCLLGSGVELLNVTAGILDSFAFEATANSSAASE